MGRKLSPEDLVVYKDVDKILWEDWDPIGVCDAEEWARDEYYGYLPEVFALVQERRSAVEIAEHLRLIANDRMGFGSTVKEHMPAALKLHALGISGMS